VAQAIAKNSELIPQLEYEINFLDGTYADDFSEIWDYFSNVLDRKYKNWYGHDEITPQLIKKHFIAQSRHRLDKFKKICDKKKRYAKMHGIDMDSDIKDDVCYLMFPDECSTAEYGPYIWNGVVKAYQHSELPDSVLCRKQNWMKNAGNVRSAETVPPAMASTSICTTMFTMSQKIIAV
jgi:hypothetical protein